VLKIKTELPAQPDMNNISTKSKRIIFTILIWLDFSSENNIIPSTSISSQSKPAHLAQASRLGPLQYKASRLSTEFTNLTSIQTLPASFAFTLIKPNFTHESTLNQNLFHGEK
jgi:hypothetical protein